MKVYCVSCILPFIKAEVQKFAQLHHMDDLIAAKQMWLEQVAFQPYELEVKEVEIIGYAHHNR